ncbi:MAG TPA: hypothetical protein VEK73_10510 [Xanthobacteraceae bacterium]|nr:hypothetical protein [Xanthobacteraceae bacterium]
MKPIARAAAGGLIGVMLVFAAGTAAIAGEDEDEDTFEMKAIKGIMRGLGAEVDRPGIDYRERSPLVIPPTRDLPPPQDATKINNPAWPNDPDLRKPVKKAKAFENGSIATRRMESPEFEKMPEVPAAPGTTVNAPDPNANKDPGRVLSPPELGFSNSMFGSMFGYKAEQRPFTGEPARTNLAQPPIGYQTPSPNYPYGIGVPTNNSVKDIDRVKDIAVGGEGN